MAIYNPHDALEAFERKNYDSVLKLEVPHAAAGNSEAQTMLALLYQCGFGVERNILEAERWLLKAAEQNNPVAWNNLGSLYAGKCPELEHRWSDATKCYERAKELGFDCAEPYPP
jgi:TPR repeat protein